MPPSSQTFQLQAPFAAAGDQPAARDKLVAALNKGAQRQTLLGVTGSGKTYTMAAVIATLQKPALVISHNKTLAAQLAGEFKEFFPQSAVSYFVSYYDYYQPEAYVPRTDTYIAKDADINDEIDRLRHAAMEAVLTRQDVIVVASVSCIYGIGQPAEYLNSRLILKAKQKMSRAQLLRQLTQLQYTRNDIDVERSTFQVRGDAVDMYPAGEEHVLRVEFFGPVIDRIIERDALTGDVLGEPDEATIFPATFYVTTPERMHGALSAIRSELQEQIAFFKARDKLVEAQRIEQRTLYDLEMMEQIGYVSGIENYSRHMEGRQPGQPSATLIDYFRHSFGPAGFLTFIDESHMTVPQLGAMSAGDRARKEMLVNYGFRLPSAYDNRPLKFNEFEDRIGPTVFVSATPADYERNVSEQVVEQLVRPTGLLDPTITVKPTEHQIDDVLDQIKQRTDKGQRVLVTTLTKRMAEELSTYLIEMGKKAAYLHADVDTLERLEILRDLRLGVYDVLVGINLLREGLDLPEVSLVAILDADKEGYLRSTTALVQIMGRAARHIEGHVIMYADRITGSMREAMEETDRRRAVQEKFNQAHHITPTSITKSVQELAWGGKKDLGDLDIDDDIPPDERRRAIKELNSKMDLAARNLDFETAARLRDTIIKIRKKK